MKAECLKCNYEWTTRSPMVLVSCPNCGNKVKVRKISDQTKEKEVQNNEI